MIQPETGGLRSTKEDIATLKNQVDETSRKKRGLQAKKQEVNKSLSESIVEFKRLKGELDTAKPKREDLQKKRDEANKQVKAFIDEVKALDREKAKVMRKHGVHGDVAHMTKRIEGMELKVETEALSVSQEKKLMKSINELKRSLEAVKDAGKAGQRLRELQVQIEEVKLMANVFHYKLLNHVKKQSENFRHFKALSKKINVLKKEKRGYVSQIAESDERFNQANELLKNKLGEFSKRKDEKRGEREKRNEALLKEKEKEVEEKIKRGKKLTNDDLLVFQKK